MKLIFTLILLSGCANGVSDPSIVYSRLNIDTPVIENFPHCRSYGCKNIDMIALDNADSQKLKSFFTTNNDAMIERKNIRNAIAYLEKTVGIKTGTDVDVAGTYVRLGNYQQDCIDESTNTTTYLMMIDQMELFKFHDVNALSSRPPILSGRLGPHRTAVIVEKQTNIKYAVDSWFHDNGVKPEIVEMDTWFWGWHPKEE
jgi:hypothetical protein